MKVTSVGLLCGLLIAILAMHSTCSAAVLQYSTYGAENGWAGYKDYKEDNFDVRVAFNVYDIDLHEFEWLGEETIPTGDEYIYVYKIFNMGDENNKDIASFTLLFADGSAIPQHLMHLTHSQDDGSEGIAPDPDGTPYQGEWVWSIDNGYIEADQHSWLLVFSSDHAPVKGTFKVQSGGEMGVPEPATIVLFGSAAGWILARRNKKRR